ncbi:MAG: hypothetical protein JNG84_05985, partial [Archangium sp.]|nr:hypothetical protein [Archangium sp.]
MMRVVLALGLAIAGGAQAAETYGESTRNFMLEAKLGPVIPLVDRAFATSQGPYQSTFGGAPMLMGELEFDVQLFQRFGSLAFGLSGGYAEKFGKARDASTGEISAASTGLRIVPIKGLLIYRFDYLALKHNIPLVPFVKAGIVVMPWWVTNGGETETADGLR